MSRAQLIRPEIPFEKREGFMPSRCQYWKRQVLPLHRAPPMVGTPPPGAEAAFNRSTLNVPEALIAPASLV